MGITPQIEGITIDFDCQFKVHLKNSHISTILAAFAALLPQVVKGFFPESPCWLWRICDGSQEKAFYLQVWQ